MEFPISLPEMAWLPRNEKKLYRLNSRPQMWPADLTLTMTLTLVFKVKYGICYISTISVPIATKQEANISIELQASNVTNGLTLAMTLTFEFSRSSVILTIWWPMSGIRKYQIVTGVTSDVGVPSTHLVDSDNGLYNNFHSREYVWKCRLQIFCRFCLGINWLNMCFFC